VDRAPRVMGLLACWAWVTFSAMRIETVGRDPQANPWLRASVVVGFFLGHAFLGWLWMDEGRARERKRAEQEKRR
jgi:hypothetical protein